MSAASFRARPELVVVRDEIAVPVRDVLNDRIGALIKGMLTRGDRQSDIASCFGINSGRVAETNRGQRFTHVSPAPLNELPPPGPYPTPYELWQMQRETWRARVAIEGAMDALQRAHVAIHKLEGKGTSA